MQFVQIKENEFSNLFECKLCRLRLPIHVSKHPLKKCFRQICSFKCFGFHLDDGCANCEALACLELGGQGEETTMFHIQVVVHLSGGELVLFAKVDASNMLIYGCPQT